VKIIDCKQGTPQWVTARLGIPTASEFDRLVTPQGKPRTGAGPRTYLMEKLAERLMGYPKNLGQSGPMEQGSIIESLARPWYEFTYDVKVQQVGFCVTDDGRCGCSPDGLIGEDGGIEIKSPETHTHLGYLLAGVVPDCYVAQVQGSLYVTGRKWWKFVSYSRHVPSLVVHVEPDPAFQEGLKTALAAFAADFDAALAKIQEMQK
jgi:hypothetical protein